MEKEFIPYEQSLALKELGFDEPCLAFFWNTGKFYTTAEYPHSIEYHKQNQLGDYNYDSTSAPTYSQSFRWFREKCNIQATIEPTKDQHRFELGFNYWIWNTKTAEEWFTEPRDRPAGDYVFDTYEEAELECLKKLIEIVKVK
jgi:hypothetical protein